jgi:pSer/pThr/pTyr-binding forkhead associated (FHA) protein
MIFRIIFLNGASKGNRITIEKESMTIGRAPDCRLVIDDEETALYHATIQHNPNNELVVKDLGSMNKILVNNHEIREAKLKHGDIVEIGRIRFLVQASVQAEVQQPPFFHPERRRFMSKTLAAALAIVAIAVIYDRCGRTASESGSAPGHTGD